LKSWARDAMAVRQWRATKLALENHAEASETTVR